MQVDEMVERMCSVIKWERATYSYHNSLVAFTIVQVLSLFYEKLRPHIHVAVSIEKMLTLA